MQIYFLTVFFFIFQESVKKKMSSLNLPRLPSKAKFWKKRSANISEVDPTFRVIYLGNVLTGWAKGKKIKISNCFKICPLKDLQEIHGIAKKIKQSNIFEVLCSIFL